MLSVPRLVAEMATKPKPAPARPKPKPTPVQTALAAYNAAVADAQKRKVKNPQTDPKVVAARKAYQAARGGAAKPTGGKDTLDPASLAEQYGYASALLNSDPELKALFQQALNDKTGQWTPAKFEARLKATKWYQTHSASWRTTEAVRLADPKTYQANIDEAVATVRAAATDLGATLNDAQVTQIATNVYRLGLSAAQLKQSLAAYVTTAPGVGMTGQAAKTEQDLRALAYGNGMAYSDDYYRNAAAAVAGGASVDTYMNQIRSEAASKFPPYREQVMAGANVRDLASGYLNAMAQTWEIDPSDISLDEPKMRAAFGQVDPSTGQPMAMGLWDFEKSLRADPRWMSTRNAQQQVAGAATSVLRTFGFMG